MIQYSDLHIAYDRVLLNNSSLTLQPGNVTLITGPSGIGKTALLYRLALFKRDCKVNSDDLDLKNIESARRQDIAFVMQDNDLISYLTVGESLKEYARMAGTSHSDQRIQEVLEQVSLDVPLDQECSLLSLGERQRLCIACALMKKPRLVILDEPTAALDGNNKTAVFELIRNLGRAGMYVVFSSHEKDAKRYADTIYRIDNKELQCVKHEDTSASIKPSRHSFHGLKMIMNHIRYYWKKNRGLLIYHSCLLVLVALVCGFAGIFTNGLLEQSRAELYEMSDKYLYITDRRNSGFMDEDTYPVSLEEGYPVYTVKTLMDSIMLVPYFDEMTFVDKIERQMNVGSKGMYISYLAAQRIRETGDLSPNMEFQLSVPGKGIVDWNGAFTGVLKQGIKSYLLKDNLMYIMLPWEEIKEICEGVEPIGRVLFYETIDELDQAKQSYEDAGYTVNNLSSRYDNIIQATQVQKHETDRIASIMNLIGFALIAIVNFIHLKTRINEFTMLRINGTPASLTALMLFLENSVALFSSVILLLISKAIFMMMGIKADIPVLFAGLGACIATELLLLLFNTIRLKSLNFEKVLRDA